MTSSLNRLPTGGADPGQHDLRLRDHVAEEIRALMARRRLSGVQLAARIDKSQGYLSRRLNGVQPFDVDDLEAIAGVLGVPVSALLRPPEIGSQGQAVTNRYLSEPDDALVGAAA
jgi:transcriptional regulator with XRE-family HTH domain